MGDFTLHGIAVTLGYMLAAVACYMSRAKKLSHFFTVASVILFLLGLNKQLDTQTYVENFLRDQFPQMRDHKTIIVAMAGLILIFAWVVLLWVIKVFWKKTSGWDKRLVLIGFFVVLMHGLLRGLGFVKVLKWLNIDDGYAFHELEWLGIVLCVIGAMIPIKDASPSKPLNKGRKV